MKQVKSNPFKLPIELHRSVRPVPLVKVVKSARMGVRYPIAKRSGIAAEPCSCLLSRETISTNEHTVFAPVEHRVTLTESVRTWTPLQALLLCRYVPGLWGANAGC